MKNRRRGVLLLAIAAAVVGAVVLFWARRHWELSPGVLESRLSELDISEEAMSVFRRIYRTFQTRSGRNLPTI